MRRGPPERATSGQNLSMGVVCPVDSGNRDDGDGRLELCDELKGVMLADYASGMPEVRRADEEVLVCGSPEQPTPCLLNLTRVVIDRADQVGAREMDRVHDRIGEKQEVPSVLLDLHCALPRRVPRRRVETNP